MLRLYLAAAVALVAIGSLTLVEAKFTDRWTSSSVDAAEFGKRFDNVPKTIGKWVGTDMPVEKDTLEMAGAVSHVSRRYVNQDNPSQMVDLWLIVGHSRDICRHTPDICYPSQGFSQLGTRVKHPIEATDDNANSGTFYTAKYRNESAAGNHIERVFWAWNGNKEGKDQWDAPDDQRQYYGNNTALYKMYFTGALNDEDEDIGQNIAVEFGKLMLPEVNKALFPDRYKTAAKASDSASSAAATDASAAAAAAETAAGPVSATPAAEAPAEAPAPEAADGK